MAKITRTRDDSGEVLIHIADAKSVTVGDTFLDVTLEGMSKDISTIKSKIGDTSKLKTAERSNIVSAVNEVLGSSNVVKVAYSKLKALRDSQKLIAGTWYRITDYQCTTIQDNTRSAGHQFDILALAIDEKTLSEECKACLHKGDDYFAASHLEAWKVWYCIDNDEDRFAWADKDHGRGVIYRLIDEWNNDCPYDFKNIQFIRSLNEEGVLDEDNGEETWVYTFNAFCRDDMTHHDATLLNQTAIDDYGCLCRDNIIKSCFTYERYPCIELNDIVFQNAYSMNDAEYYVCFSNSFGNNCSSNSFGNDCYYNSFGNNCSSNSFGNNCYSNSFGNYCFLFERFAHNNLLCCILVICM